MRLFSKPLIGDAKHQIKSGDTGAALPVKASLTSGGFAR